MNDGDRLGSSDCERLRPGRIAQPINATTSLGYVAVAGIVLRRHGRGAGVPRRREVGLYAGLLGLVGAGSVAFHGPQFTGARQLHDLPIPALVAVVAGTPLWRRRHEQHPVPGWTPGRGVRLLVTSAGGLACYLGGRSGARSCRPDSRWQWHGAWHLTSAASFGLAAGILYAAPVPGSSRRAGLRSRSPRVPPTDPSPSGAGGTR